MHMHVLFMIESDCDIWWFWKRKEIYFEKGNIN